ncbi:MAG: glycosyltransferase [Muribaculaceae bacterium]|nr:glycosyltransferase [Muribaculaceae bacterium]
MTHTDSHDAGGNNTTRPLISLITVTYNAAATIGATLESVRRQDFRHFEHIIVDGASADATLDMVRAGAPAWQRLHSEPDRGLYDAMNRGLDMAAGDYVMFLNAGDTLHSTDTLSKIADIIMDNDYPGVVYGQTDIVNASRQRVADRHLRAPDRLTLKSFAQGMVVCHQAFVALKRITAPFDLRYRFSADYDWCIRVLQHSRRNVMMPGVMVDYLAEGMTTRNRRASLAERFRIMCFYYGVLPTLWRHIKFIPRFIRRSRIEKNF